MLDKFNEVLERLRKGASEGVTLDTKISDLPIDSLDLFSIISELEESTGKTMDDDNFQEIVTVQSIVKFFSD